MARGGDMMPNIILGPKQRQKEKEVGSENNKLQGQTKNEINDNNGRVA